MEQQKIKSRVRQAGSIRSSNVALVVVVEVAFGEKSIPF
jgi:hypothetical protein